MELGFHELFVPVVCAHEDEHKHYCWRSMVEGFASLPILHGDIGSCACAWLFRPVIVTHLYRNCVGEMAISRPGVISSQK